MLMNKTQRFYLLEDFILMNAFTRQEFAKCMDWLDEAEGYIKTPRQRKRHDKMIDKVAHAFPEEFPDYVLTN